MSLSKIPPRRKKCSAEINKSLIPLPKSCQQIVVISNPDPEKFEQSKFGLRNILVCRETFLPAYASLKEYETDFEKHFPGFAAEKKWRCIHCGRYHVTGYFPRGSINRHMRTEKTLKEAMKNE